jgi:hypothetical protein
MLPDLEKCMMDLPGDKQLKRAPKDRAPDSIEDHFRAAPGSRICFERATIPVAQVKLQQNEDRIEYAGCDQGISFHSAHRVFSVWLKTEEILICSLGNEGALNATANMPSMPGGIVRRL